MVPATSAMPSTLSSASTARPTQQSASRSLPKQRGWYFLRRLALTPRPPAPLPAWQVWANSRVVRCIRAGESGGNYAEDTGNGYYGAYQDWPETWTHVTGLPLPPQDYPPSVQDQGNYKIYLEGGWHQWPQTSVQCGV